MSNPLSHQLLKQSVSRLYKLPVIPFVKQRQGKRTVTKNKSLALVVVLISTTTMTACGFHLRGYASADIGNALSTQHEENTMLNPIAIPNRQVQISMADDATSFPLKYPLQQQLGVLGIQSQISSDPTKGIQNSDIGTDIGSRIHISDVHFKRFELVGVLTEIRLVLSANVSYQVWQDGQLTTISNPILIERSYQYNEASVNVEDQQGKQIQEWLYSNLARRISDQYMALSLPKVTPDEMNKTMSNKI